MLDAVAAEGKTRNGVRKIPTANGREYARIQFYETAFIYRTETRNTFILLFIRVHSQLSLQNQVAVWGLAVDRLERGASIALGER